MVRKKDSTWRVYIDYQELNDITVFDTYHMPPASELIRAAKDHGYFVLLDLKSGYWQVLIEEKSRKYSAFRIPLGVMEHVIIPFGLTNALATFQRMMDNLLEDLKEEGVSVYLDDILIHASTFEKCLELTRKVFKRLEENGLTIHLKKSKFFPETIKYLGHILGKGEIKPDQDKVMAIQNQKMPTNVIGVRSIIGALGYYQGFISEYAKKMMPLYALINGVKNKKEINNITPVIWTEEQEKSVQEALDSLADAILATLLT